MFRAVPRPVRGGEGRNGLSWVGAAPGSARARPPDPQRLDAAPSPFRLRSGTGTGCAGPSVTGSDRLSWLLAKMTAPLRGRLTQRKTHREVSSGGIYCVRWPEPLLALSSSRTLRPPRRHLIGSPSSLPPPLPSRARACCGHAVEGKACVRGLYVWLFPLSKRSSRLSRGLAHISARSLSGRMVSVLWRQTPPCPSVPFVSPRGRCQHVAVSGTSL